MATLLSAKKYPRWRQKSRGRTSSEQSMPTESDLRNRLLCRIHRRYQVVTEDLTVGGIEFPFTRVANPDMVLDQVAAQVDLQERLHGRAAVANQSMHLPYWAELWDSAMGIGLFLADRVKSSEPAATVRPHRVLDLGCGMGLAGTVAAALGSQTLFADLEAPALLFARLNSLPWRSRVRTRQLDWQRHQLDQRFDLILGADILYEKAQWPYLEPFWRAHLAHEGSVLLAEPGRATGDLFLDWIAGRGWNLSIAEQSVSTRPKPIRLFILGR
jgi:predicted nicotinamide N-methyase